MDDQRVSLVIGIPDNLTESLDSWWNYYTYLIFRAQTRPIRQVKCVFFGCTEMASDAAHVYLEKGYSDNLCFLAPVCSKCPHDVKKEFPNFHSPVFDTSVVVLKLPVCCLEKDGQRKFFA